MAENVFAVTQSGGAGSPTPTRLWVDSRMLVDRQIAVPTTPRQAGAVCLVSSGPCLPGNRIRVVDAAGGDLADGHVGEILIQSDSLFDGYYNRPELTATAITGGWYRSRDLGLRLHGEVYVTGRKDDLIIVAGKNIQPHDLEQIASADPRIHDGRVVAFGLFNPDLGTEDIVIVAEVEDERDLADVGAIEQRIRNLIVAELGVAVRRVYLRPPKWIVKSTAGKPARSTTRQKLLQEETQLAREEKTQ
jgi:acyl-CoA synthetase (AMP-forming)/AMP-acid ligase II